MSHHLDSPIARQYVRLDIQPLRVLHADNRKGNIMNAINLMSATATRPPLPPFTRETAAQKVRLAEDGWNSRNPEKVAVAYTIDSWWRNRAEFVQGHLAIMSPRSRSDPTAAQGRGPMYRIRSSGWTSGRWRGYRKPPGAESKLSF